MKTWRKRTTYGLAVVAAAVAIPLTAGSASAASWHNVAGGPEMYPDMAACKADIPQAEQHYSGDVRCTETDGQINMEVWY